MKKKIPVTIILDFVSVIIAIVSLYVAFQANERSKEANEIAKQANEISQEANQIALQSTQANLKYIGPSDTQLRFGVCKGFPVETNPRFSITSVKAALTLTNIGGKSISGSAPGPLR